MNLHISNDDKFLDTFIANQQKYSDSENLYMVVSSKENFRFVKSKNVFYCPKNIENFESVLTKLPLITKIYFHSLKSFFVQIINELHLDKKYNLVWIFYGGELLSLSSYSEKFLQEKTLHLYKEEQKNRLFQWTFNPVELRRRWLNHKHYTKQDKQVEKDLIRAIKKLQYVALFIKSDFYNYILPINKNLKLIEWTYGVNTGIKENISVEKKDKIILGNSASKYNNHLDGFDFIKKNIKEIKWKIITPLSYNDRNGYAQKIIKKGKEHFEDFFIPLTDFMDKGTYYELLFSCKAAVYFNLRTQAAGNIFWLIVQEIPVFLSEKSDLYNFLKEMNVKLFTIENDLPKFLNNELDIDSKTMEENFKIIQNFLSEEKVKERYINLLEKID
jgi:dTDP-N-acetylfucosamine:lipid II N-acetylfucosaminyltransferase